MIKSLELKKEELNGSEVYYINIYQQGVMSGLNIAIDELEKYLKYRTVV